MSKKQIIGVTISIVLILALFIAVIFSYFLPFGDEKALAEVSILQTGKTYTFTNYALQYLYYENEEFQACGTIKYLNSTYVFSNIELNIDNNYNLLLTFGLLNIEPSAGDGYLQLLFTEQMMNPWWILDTVYINGNSIEQFQTVYNSIYIEFEQIPNTEVSIKDFLLRNLEETIINVNITPDISLKASQSNIEVNASTVIAQSLPINLFVLNNPEAYTAVDGIISFTMDFLAQQDNNTEVLYDRENIKFRVDNNGEYTALLAVPYNFIQEHSITRIFIYYGENTTDKIEISNLQTKDIDISVVTTNYNIFNANYSFGYYAGYSVGYMDGEAEDQTLISVIWEVFKFPFKILFGEYDNRVGSETYGEYVNGLFTFTILGVDMRVFVVGLFSFAIIISIIRWIL